MTSNLGSHIIQEKLQSNPDLDGHSIEKLYREIEDQVLELLHRSIRPEFLNRIDEIIMFSPLTRNEIRQIVDLQFNLLREKLASQQISISMEPAAAEKLSEMAYDPLFGARPLKRVLQRKVLNELSKQIIAGQIHANQEIVLDMEGDEFVFRNKAKQKQNT